MTCFLTPRHGRVLSFFLPLQVHGCVRMDDFLGRLSKQVPFKDTSLQIFCRLYVPPADVPPSAPGSPLQTKVGTL